MKFVTIGLKRKEKEKEEKHKEKYNTKQLRSRKTVCSFGLNSKSKLTNCVSFQILILVKPSIAIEDVTS